MTDMEQCCVYERIAKVEFRNVRDDLTEVKARVGQLERFLVRGLVLLVVNLLGIGVVVFEQLVQ